MNVINIRVVDDDLFNAIILKRAREKEKFLKVLKELKRRPMRATEIEKLYGSSTAYTLIKRLVNAGMIKKDGKYYVLSKEFSKRLRKFAQEWEEFVEE